MHITWHGQYSIAIQSGETTLLIDPRSPETGLPPLKMKADIVALTSPDNPDMSHVETLQGEPFLIDRPGEYSLTGFSLKAHGWYSDDGQEHNLQRWMIEDMILLHVGALTRNLEEKELAELEKTDIDVLFLPVGGGLGLNTKDALSLLTRIEPKVVVPIHYKIPKVKENLEDVAQFAKEVGADPANRDKKLILKQNKLPQEGMTIVLLQP